jgi:hypothetical protein
VIQSTIKIPISVLKILTVFYLAFPYFIFFLGWLKLPIGIFLSVTLLYGLYIFTKSQSIATPNFKISLSNLILCILIVLIWVLFSGAGGFGYQNHDYFKHNFLQFDLTKQTWPVMYHLKNGTKYLSHYLAYYLPGPAIFYGLGWKYVQLANFFLTLSGILLAIFWMLRFVGKFTFWIVLLFIFASGTQIFTLIFQNGTQSLPLILDKIRNHGFLFWMNGLGILPINFMSASDMLYWGPQHAISCWLAIGLLLNDWLIDKNLKHSPFYISLIAFWSPLGLIGLAPFLLVALINTKFKAIVNAVNLLIAPIVFVVIALFLTSISTTELLHHFLIHDRSADGITILSQIGAYFYFVTFEILIWWVPAYLVLKNKVNETYKLLFWTALVVLLLTPFFRYGLYNDWCTRVSLPALFVMYVMMLLAILKVESKNIRMVLLSICIVSALGPAILILSSIRSMGYRIKWEPPLEQNMQDLSKTDFPVEQFVADPDCFFYKYIAKQKE